MKQQRTMIVLAVAVITAGVASFLVYRALQNVPVREVEVASIPVVVAARGIPVGTRLTADHLRVAAWPAKNPVPGSFSDVQGAVDRGVIATIAENQPITVYNVAGPEAGAGLPPVIPEGMRAVSVRVNDVVGVAGFVVPGTRVDVLVSVTNDGSSRPEPMARTVVTNVLVLTAGTRFDQQDAQGNEAQRATVVTLAVLPEDGERIALASNQGQISLALRNPVDAEPTQTRGIKLATLMEGPGGQPVVQPQPNRAVVVRQAAPPAVEAPPPAPKAYTVETIRAQRRAEEVLR